MPILPLFPDDSQPELKTCTKCGEAKPLADYYIKVKATGRLFSWCKGCHNRITLANFKAKYAEDPEPFKRSARAYRAENLEACKARQKEKRLADPEKARAKDRAYDARRKEKKAAYRREKAEQRKAYNAEYRRINRDGIKAKNDRYRALRPEVYSLASARWKRLHPELSRIVSKRAKHKRRCLLADAGTYTLAEWAAVKAACDHRCVLCGLREPMIRLTIDHIIPLSRGGMNTASNLQPLCARCNSHKRTRDWDLRPSPKRRRPQPITR